MRVTGKISGALVVSLRLGLTLLVVACVCVPLSAQAMADFLSGKKEVYYLYSQLDAPVTFYCRCPILFGNDGGAALDVKNCGYNRYREHIRIKGAGADSARATRLEVEHIMPAWEFGHERSCWTAGKRKGCQRRDAGFNVIEGDLWNLVLVIGEVNMYRSNYRFSEWNAQKFLCPDCRMSIDVKHRQVQPPEHTRGLIARTYLYMAKEHGIRLSEAQRRLMQVWDQRYPPDDFECSRAELIKVLQGNDNEFVSAKCRSQADTPNPKRQPSRIRQSEAAPLRISGTPATE
ncbi:MAG: endonuclease [Succinivibrio sp.]|nr:endonuclease [Succinivibrio sp.]